MLLRARGKERVERVSIAGWARRPTGAWAKRWLSHWAKQTHTPSDRTSEAKALWKKDWQRPTFLSGPEGTRGDSIRDFRAAIDAGTTQALVKPLSKANMHAVMTARSRRRPSSKRKNSEHPLQQNPDARSGSKATTLFRLSPNAPMNGAGVRSTEASVPLAG